MATTTITHKCHIGQEIWFARFGQNNKIMLLNGKIKEIHSKMREEDTEVAYWVEYANPQNDDRERTIVWEDWAYIDKSSALARYDVLLREIDN